MLARKDFLFNPIGRSEHAVNVTDLVEALDAGLNRKDVVLLSRFYEQRTWRDQASDVVHLGPVQYAGHVVVDTVGEAADAVSRRVEIATYHRSANPRFERGSKKRGGATA